MVMGERLLSLIFSYLHFPLTYKILIQRRQGKLYLPCQEYGIEKNAIVPSGQGKIVFIDTEQLIPNSSHLCHRMK